MEISKDIRYIGVNDHEIDLFEGQYLVQDGMAYNSYLIKDEKNAVMDTVDEKFGEKWLASRLSLDMITINAKKPQATKRYGNDIQQFSATAHLRSSKPYHFQ